MTLPIVASFIDILSLDRQPSHIPEHMDVLKVLSICKESERSVVQGA